MPNKVRADNIDDDVEKLLKAWSIHESDENYPKDVLRMYAEDGLAMKRNEAVLNDLPGELYTVKANELYTVKANDKIPDNCKYPLMTKQEILVILNLPKAVFVKYM